MNTRESFIELQARLSGAVIGLEHVMEHLLIGLLADAFIAAEQSGRKQKRRSGASNALPSLNPNLNT